MVRTYGVLGGAATIPMRQSRRTTHDHEVEKASARPPRRQEALPGRPHEAHEMVVLRRRRIRANHERPRQLRICRPRPRELQPEPVERLGIRYLVCGAEQLVEEP